MLVTHIYIYIRHTLERITSSLSYLSLSPSLSLSLSLSLLHVLIVSSQQMILLRQETTNGRNRQQDFLQGITMKIRFMKRLTVEDLDK